MFFLVSIIFSIITTTSYAYTIDLNGVENIPSTDKAYSKNKEELDLQKIKGVIGTLEVENDDELDNYLKKYSPVRIGRSFSPAGFSKLETVVKEFYEERGFLDHELISKLSVRTNEGRSFIDINLKIKPGIKYKINKITILGNEDPYDLMLRKIVSVNSDDVVNTKALKIMETNLQNSNRFATDLEWRMNKIAPGLVNLDIDLKAEVNKYDIHLTAVDTCCLGSNEGNPYIILNFNKQSLDNKSMSCLIKVKAGEDSFKTLFDFNHRLPYLSNILGGCYMTTDLVNYKFSSQNLRITDDDYRAYLQYLETSFFEALNIQVWLGIKVERSLIHYYPRYTPTHHYESIFNKRQAYDYFGFALSQKSSNEDPYRTSSFWGWNASIRFNEGPFITTEVGGEFKTPVIDDDKLVFSSRIKGRFVKDLNNDGSCLPYCELAYSNNASFIRGFRWGDAGPVETQYCSTPLGATKMLCLQNELVMPWAKQEFKYASTKIFAFYDVGALWDTPLAYVNHFGDNIKHNEFDLYHSVGIGLKMYNQASIDFGIRSHGKGLTGTFISLNSTFDF